MEEMETTLVNYANALIRNTEDRLKESLPVVTAFFILDPLLIPSASELQVYGLAEIELIAKHFSHDQSDQQEKVKVEWGEI